MDGKSFQSLDLLSNCCLGFFCANQELCCSRFTSGSMLSCIHRGEGVPVAKVPFPTVPLTSHLASNPMAMESLRGQEVRVAGKDGGESTFVDLVDELLRLQ